MSSSSISSGNRRFASDLKGYKLISSSYQVEWNYEGEEIHCYCDEKAPRWTSWTDENPGRRFYGCKNYKNERYCEFLTGMMPCFLIEQGR
ncbi:Zinc finger, GRF-type [Corchorus olitorius]|uniref:Zinc finger, GRF-type n=1 Tax=Corchorus olitorius TaxID=93759 RepID=A0A1R3GY39_9ROSI|nr:Zinc finger, GRF-type [Corchorus olitorius]